MARSHWLFCFFLASAGLDIKGLEIGLVAVSALNHSDWFHLTNFRHSKPTCVSIHVVYHSKYKGIAQCFGCVESMSSCPVYYQH